MKVVRRWEEDGRLGVLVYSGLRMSCSSHRQGSVAWRRRGGGGWHAFCGIIIFSAHVFVSGMKHFWILYVY